MFTLGGIPTSNPYPSSNQKIGYIVTEIGGQTYKENLVATQGATQGEFEANAPISGTIVTFTIDGTEGTGEGSISRFGGGGIIKSIYLYW